MDSKQQSDFVAEIEFRRRVAGVLGTAESRKAARERFGLTLRQVAAEVGLSSRARRAIDGGLEALRGRGPIRAGGCFERRGKNFADLDAALPPRALPPGTRNDVFGSDSVAGGARLQAFPTATHARVRTAPEKHPLIAKLTRRETQFVNGSNVAIAGGTLANVNGPHPHTLIFEELEVLEDGRVFDESRVMTQGSPGHRALDVIYLYAQVVGRSHSEANGRL